MAEAQRDGDPALNLYELERESGVNRSVIHRHIDGPLRRKRTLLAREYVTAERVMSGRRHMVRVELNLKGEMAMYSEGPPGFNETFLRKYEARWGLKKDALRAYLALFFLIYLPTRKELGRWILPVPVTSFLQDPGFSGRVMWLLQEPFRIAAAYASLRALFSGGMTDPRATVTSFFPPVQFWDLWLRSLLSEGDIKALASDLKRRGWKDRARRDLEDFGKWIERVSSGRPTELPRRAPTV